MHKYQFLKADIKPWLRHSFIKKYGIPTTYVDTTLNTNIINTLTTVQGKIKNFKLRSKLEQTTTRGKNKFNINGDVNTRYDGSTSTKNTVSGNDLTATANGGSSHSYGQKIYVGSGNKVVASFILKSVGYSGSSTGAVAYVAIYNDNDLTGKVSSSLKMSNVGERNQLSLTAATDYIYLCFGKASISTSATFTNIQLEIGSTATYYEPYTGEIPAPNPNYQQEIYSISGDIEIKIESTNLWDEEWEIGKYNSTTGIKEPGTDNIRSKNKIRCKENTQYYICINDNNNGKLRVLYYDKNNNFLSAGESIRNTIITTPQNTAYINFMLTTSYGLTYKNNVCINVSNININGNYYSHEEQTLLLNLGNLEYCRIANCKDEFYLATENDTSLVAGKWYLKKNIGKVVLDGSESWTLSSGFANSFWAPLINAKIISLNDTETYVISDKYFSTYRANILNYNYSIVLSNDGNIMIHNKDISNASDFEAALVNSNVTAYYCYETPEYILLNDTLQSQLNALTNNINSYKGQTNIIIETNINTTFDLSYATINS